MGTQIPQTSPGRVGEVRLAVETTPNVAVSTPSTYWATGSIIRVIDPDPSKLTYNATDDLSSVSNSFADYPRLLTGKGGSLDFKTYSTGLNQKAQDNVAVTQETLGLLLKSAFGGGESLGTSSTIAAGNTGVGATTAIKVTNPGGLHAGDAVVVNGEMRRIVSIAGQNVTLDVDLSNVPTAGDLVIAGATYYMSEVGLTDLSNALHQTVAALFRGYHASDQYQVRGCFPELAVAEVGPEKILQFAWMLHCQAWEKLPDSTVAAVAPPTLVTPPTQIASGLYLAPSGTTAVNRVSTKSAAIAPGMKPMAQGSPTGENGVVGHVVVGGRSSIEFEPFFDGTWNVKFEARTPYVGGYQVGKPSAVAGCIGFTWPNLTIDDTPTRQGSKDSSTTLKVKMHGDYASSGADDRAKSKFSVHLFPHT